ncbi:MAG: Ribosomal protein methyltransferase [Pseudomonadota bacterium]|jgi:SAM-dependent methyltransferase
MQSTDPLNLHDASMKTVATTIAWQENGHPCEDEWRSERGALAPKRVVLADDTLSADSAYRLACAGTGMLWRGDFQNARLLLQALARRCDAPKKIRRTSKTHPEVSHTPEENFHLHRQAQSQRARTLSMILIQVNPDRQISLRRAPDWRGAMNEAWGPAGTTGCVASLRELLGLVGAHEWHQKGMEISALGSAPNNRIYPSYGVFSPVRGEYIQLVADAPLPSTELAFDIGVGTGVLSAVLAKRGVKRVVGTDLDPRAMACAKENIQRLGLNSKVELTQTDLFPEGKAPLIVCNPPWLPARASAPIERAIYDENSGMLKGFLAGLAAHLAPKGEGWLILSDLAEHLGLRTRAELDEWIAAGGLKVISKTDIKAEHKKAQDETDPLHAARAAELTSLWRLSAA